MPINQFCPIQKIIVAIHEVWNLISSPNNLNRITPDYIGFYITSKHMIENIYTDMVISFKPTFGFIRKIANTLTMLTILWK